MGKNTLFNLLEHSVSERTMSTRQRKDQILVLSHKKLLNVATRQAKHKPVSADRRAPTMCQATSSASSQASAVWISGQHGRLTVVEPLPPIKVKNLKDLKLCQYMLEKYLTGLGSRSLGIGPQMCCSPSMDTCRNNTIFSVYWSCLGHAYSSVLHSVTKLDQASKE
nr:uncharacterized protein RGD1564409 isoform X2 [Rattus norvegicus]